MTSQTGEFDAVFHQKFLIRIFCQSKIGQKKIGITSRPGMFCSVFFMIKAVYLIRFHTVNCLKISVFSQKIDIYSDSIQAKSTFVVSKWCHNVTWKLGCFPAHEKGEYSKDSGILQLTKMGPFLGRLFAAWCVERLVGMVHNLGKEGSCLKAIAILLHSGCLAFASSTDPS